MMVENVYVLIFCRILRGIIAGGICVIVPLFNNEILTSSIKAPLLGLMHIIMAFGSLNVYIISINTPIVTNTKEESEKIYCNSVEDKYIPWRELFLLPIIPALLQLFLLIFVFKQDSDSLSKLKISSVNLIFRLILVYLTQHF